MGGAMTSDPEQAAVNLNMEIITLARMIPQRKDLVVFVGRNRGLLLDNVKYAFLEAASGDYAFESLFVTTMPEEAEELARRNLPVCLFPGNNIRLPAQAALVVCDNFDWRLTPLWPLLHRAKVFQLWHGIPLKKIGRVEIESPVNMDTEKAGYLETMYSNYDAVVSTSPAVSRIFSDVFYAPAENYAEAGFPRNDALLKSPKANDFINVDTDLYGKIRTHRKAGGKVILHMPTFRDSGVAPLEAQGIDPGNIATFALEHNLLWALKLHPSLILPKKEYPGLIVCKSTSDVYPLLRESDILLTDYSSVYFDYLLCDRPIHFHLHDLAEYTSQSREFMLNFDEWRPGPASYSEAELFALLERTLRGEDLFGAERKRMRDILFTDQDAGSSARVCRHIEKLLGFAG